MLDSLLHRQIAPHLSLLTNPLSQKNISPNLVTGIGFVIGVAGCFCVGMALYIPGLILLLLNRIADLADGHLARQTGKETDRGLYLNVVLTRIIYAAFLFLFALSTTTASMAAAFVLFTYASMNAASMMRALLAQKNGFPQPPTGLIGHVVITLFMAACCIRPDMFAFFAAAFGIACCVNIFNDVWKLMRDY